MSKKKLFAASALIAASATMTVSASGIADVYVDGVKQSYDVPAIVEDGRTLVPLRGVFEVFGAEVEWDGTTKAITAKRGIDEIKLVIDNNEAYVNGEKIILDKAPLIKDNRTLIPLRFVSEALGAKVDWEDADRRVVISSKENDEYWWYKFPTQSESVEDASKVNARSIRTNYAADFAWGHAAQRYSYEEQVAMRNTAPDKKVVSYYEAAGQMLSFATAYQKNADGTFNYFNKIDGDKGSFPKLICNAWSWTSENLDTANYFDYTGIHNDVNDGPINGELFSKKNTGLKDPTYPDGSSALGYDESGEIPYPLNAKIYDAAGGKDINGNLHVEADMIEEENPEHIAKVKVGSSVLPKYVGYYEGEEIPFRHFVMNKDISNPFWKDYDRITASEFSKTKCDGAWFDNYSPWDNFGSFNAMFGEWSVAKFNTYLKENFEDAELKKLGIDDINTFDIREYIKNFAEELGASNPDDTGSREYTDDAWIDNQIWNAYKIFKSQEGSDYLKSLYKTVKEETKDRKEGFAVIGNDMPKLNHGWLQDSYLDIVGSEVSSGWDLTFGSRGVMAPPIGKMAIYEKMAREHQKGPYPILWLYSNGSSKGKTEMGKVYLSEAFANNTFVKSGSNTVGTEESHKWLNEFAEKEEDKLLGRYDYYDIAILFSPSNQLLGSVPNSPITGPDMNKQYHMQGLWGFGQALIDAHIPFRYIPEWKLTSQTLQGVKILVVPTVEVMSDDTFEVLYQYVSNGGKLVMTGAAGTRYDEKQLFKKRQYGLFEDLLMKDTNIGASVKISDNPSYFNETIVTKAVGAGEIKWCADPIGYNYFMSSSDRDELIETVVDFVGKSSVFDGYELPATVGAFTYRSANNRVIWTDLVNYNVDEETDAVTEAQNLKFKIKLPEGATVKSAQAICPEGNYEAEYSIDNGYATVSVPMLKYYTSVRIEIE